MMQGGGMYQDWRITPEDRAKHDAQFFQLKPVGGFVSGDIARGLFLQSGLPQPVLGHIWSLSDINGDGKLDKLEFSIAMFLIKKKLEGVDLPPVLPPSLKQAPMPAMGGFGAQSMGMVRPMTGFATMPGMQLGMQAGVGGGSRGMQPGGFNTLPSRTGNLAGFGSVPAQQSAMARAGSLPPGMQASPERARSSSIGADWAVPHNSKLKFTQMFNTQDRTRSGYLTGAQARNVLVQSGLGQNHLAQIWNLSDVDNDGRLTCEEFCLALHLVDVAKSGKALPSTLPPELIPPSYRRARSTSLTSVGAPAVPVANMPPPAMPSMGMPAALVGLGGMGGMGPMGPMGMTPAPLSPSLVKQQSVDEQPAEEEKKFMIVSFEDKKRQNFEKGQQELERRRAALREVQEREKERQRELEKQEQERKERIRLEQERRRQLELERQMQKQREIEAEREAQRRKLEEQREAARREMERQRQMEIERQRRQELEAKRIKHQEEVCHLKSTNKTLTCQIETLEDKKNELNKKITESSGEVQQHQTTIILMAQSRDAKVTEIERLQQQIQEHRQLKQQRAKQKEELQVHAKKLNINLQVSDTYASVMTSYANKQKTLERLRATLQEVETKTASSLQNTDSCHSKLSDLKSAVVKEQNEIDQQKRLYQSKMAEYQKKKARMDEEKHQASTKQSMVQNERLKQEALQKKEEEEKQNKMQQYEVIRLAQQQQAGKEKEEAERGRKEEERKKEEEEEEKTKTRTSAKADSFGSSENDPFQSAFGNDTAAPSANPSDPFAAFSGDGTSQTAKSQPQKKDPFSTFADFSNSTFDFGQGFKIQSEKTPSATASIINPTTSPATLATPPAIAPQATTTTVTAKATTLQPSPLTLQSSPLTIQPVKQAKVETKTTANLEMEPKATLESSNNHVPDSEMLPKNLKSVLSQYRAVYQFNAEGPDELSVKPGDIILVGKNQNGEPGWLGGELNGKTGWFPENYAEKLPSPPSSPIKTPSKNGPVISSSKGPSLASFKETKKTEEVKQQSSPALTPVPTPNLTPSPVPAVAPTAALAAAPTAPLPAVQEPAKPSPQPSPVPASTKSVSALAAAFTAAAEASTVPQVSAPKVIEREVDDSLASNASASSFTKVVPLTAPSPTPNQGTIPAKGTTVKAVYDWEAKKDNHLSFKAGDVIIVTEKQDMWWSGELDGRKGWFPKAHVQQDEESVPEGSSHTFTSEPLNDPSAFAIYANTPKMVKPQNQPTPQENDITQRSVPEGSSHTFTPKPLNDPSAFAIYANTPKIAKPQSPAPQENDVTQASHQANEECVALYSYTSEEPDDLVFEAGRRITVIKKEGEWWTGKIGDREGIFPSNYVQLPDVGAQPAPETKSQSAPETTAQPAADTNAQVLAPLVPQVVPADVAAKTGSLSKKPEIAKVIAPYQATGVEQLSLQAGQLIMIRKKNTTGWWEGELQARGKKRQIGWFPANYVKLMESSGKMTPIEQSRSPSGLAPPSQPEQRVTPGIDIVCQVITVYAYIKQNEDELAFQKGMVINVMNKDDPDWWKGELNGSVGVFPSNYVQELGDSKSTPAIN